MGFDEPSLTAMLGDAGLRIEAISTGTWMSRAGWSFQDCVLVTK